MSILLFIGFIESIFSLRISKRLETSNSYELVTKFCFFETSEGPAIKYSKLY